MKATDPNIIIQPLSRDEALAATSWRYGGDGREFTELVLKVP